MYFLFLTLSFRNYNGKVHGRSWILHLSNTTVNVNPDVQSALQHFVGDFARLLIWAQSARTQFTISSRIHRCPQNRISEKPMHHTGGNVFYSFRTVCRFFNVPHLYCETGPTVYRPYPRGLESLTICRCHYKGSRSVGPVEVWTCDLPHGSPVLYQLS